MALSNQKQDIILKPEFQINRSSQKLYQLINNSIILTHMSCSFIGCDESHVSV